MVVKKNGKSKEERTMKKMVTNMKTLVALLMAGAAVTSCSSDNEMDSPKAPAGKTYTMTVQATKSGDATTRALADGGDGTLTATWATTENVYVKNDDTWATGTLQPQADGATATLKGTLSDVTIAANDVLTLQFPKSGDITYAGQKGTLADIAENFDWAIAENVTVTSVDGGNITTNDVTFHHQQAIVKFTLVDKANTSTYLSPTALTINDGSSDIVTLTSIPAETYTTNLAGVLYVALPAVSSKPITLTATVGSDTYTLTTSSAKSFDNGSYYRVTAKMAKQASVPDGALSGKFSVSATKQVYFSQGNLRYASGTWSFFDNQYDYYTSYSADAWNHFGWSTSANTYGMNTSPSSSDYSGDFVDWGNNSALQTALGTGWYTLSSAEWTYLFKTRTNAASKFGYATVAGKEGIIIVPDDFTDPMKNNGSGAFVGSTTTGWTANVYSAENWSAMETAGCVFLPAAGWRNGSTVEYAGWFGSYRSSTADGSGNVYVVTFNWEDVTPEDNTARHMGYSVRLVREVE
jgi:hypothetical protein